MTDKKQDKGADLPYGADIKIMNAIVDTIGRKGKIETRGLYKEIIATNNPIKSYSKKMAEFLGLIIPEGLKLSLSKNGSLYRACKNEEEKKLFLAKHLPEKYLTILGWINNNPDSSMSINELKKAIIRVWGDRSNQDVFDWMINNFANFCSWVGVVNYIKGQNSRCVITELGRNALNIEVSGGVKEDIVTNQKENSVVLEGEYPIKIITKDGKPFDWDIHTDADWKLVEAALTAIKARWQKTKNIQPNSKVVHGNTKEK